MNRPLRSLLFALVSIPAAHLSLRAQSAERTVVAPGIYLITTPFDGYVKGNAVAIVNTDHVVVFDANTTPSMARMVIAEIRKTTSLPVRIVINSHWHPDHWSGNEVYAKEFPGVQFVATQETRERMVRVAPSWPPSFTAILNRRRAALDTAISTGRLTDGTLLSPALRAEREKGIADWAAFVNEMSAVQRVFPTVTYVDSLTLYAEGREIRLFSHYGDAEASTVAYLPNERVLLVGDLLVHPVQWTTNSYLITPWIASLKALGALDVQAIVPGHGPVFRDRTYLLAVTELLEAARARVYAALASGAVSVADVQQAVNLDAFRAKLARGDKEVEDALRETVQSLVRKLYLEARGGLEGRR